MDRFALFSNNIVVISFVLISNTCMAMEGVCAPSAPRHEPNYIPGGAPGEQTLLSTEGLPDAIVKCNEAIKNLGLAQEQDSKNDTYLEYEYYEYVGSSKIQECTVGTIKSDLRQHLIGEYDFVPSYPEALINRLNGRGKTFLHLFLDLSEYRLTRGQGEYTCKILKMLPALLAFVTVYDVNINIQDKAGDTPLHYIVKAEYPSIYGSKYCIYLSLPPAIIFARLLLKCKGITINIQNNQGKTPLHYAMHNLKLAELLCAHGADLNSRDKDGKTPFHCAVAQMAHLTAEALDKYFHFFKSYDINPLLQDNNGNTLTHLVVMTGSKRIRSAYQKYFGQDGFDEPNKAGITPRMMIKAGKSQCVIL